MTALKDVVFVMSVDVANTDDTTIYLNHSLSGLAALKTPPPGKVVPFSEELFPEVVELQVTQADIDQGLRRNARGCAVSRAASRRFDGADVAVDGMCIRVTTNRGPVTYWPEGRCHDITSRNPIKAFVNDFDFGYTVDPTTFRLVREPSVLRQLLLNHASV